MHLRTQNATVNMGGFSFRTSGTVQPASGCVIDCLDSVVPPNCVGVGHVVMGRVGASGDWAATNLCPDGCQALIDTMYSTCGGCEDWDDINPLVKTSVEAAGCAGAVHAYPSLLVVVSLFIFWQWNFWH